MKRFIAFVRKEFFHILRDKRTLVVMFGMPTIQVILFGFAITTEISDANIAILDNSKDATTRSITNKILSTGYFKLDGYLRDENDVERAFQNGRVKQVIIFGRDFGAKFKYGNAQVQMISDATDPNTGTTLMNYTTAILQDYVREEHPEFKEIQPLIVQTRMWYNPELKGVYYFIPGVIALILMLVSAMLTSISIAREKELGTMEVLLVSPMMPVQIVVAKVIPYLFLSFINSCLILLLGVFVFGIPIEGSLPLLLSEMFLFIVVALSLGVLISSVAKTQQVALMLSLFALMLPTILLSGFIFPIENMPLVLQLLSHVNPAKWFVIILKDIILKGSGLDLLWQETLILVGFGFVFIMASIKKFKVRLE